MFPGLMSAIICWNQRPKGRKLPGQPGTSSRTDGFSARFLRAPNRSRRSPTLYGASKTELTRILGNPGAHLRMGCRGAAPAGLRFSARRSVSTAAKHAGDCRPDRRDQRTTAQRRERSGGRPSGGLSNAGRHNASGGAGARPGNGGVQHAQDSQAGRQAHARYEEVAEARSQLKDLSARLVQAQETERRALSRELHDEVGQSLSAVLIELRNLSTGLGLRSDDQSRTQVEIIKGLVESTVRVVRNMALLLRPSMLDDLGLVPALSWQAREVSKRTSMDVSVAAEFVSDDLPDEYKTCIYRVVQEALHNCSRHAHANAVRIRVQQEPDRLTLSIQDDGQGFDVTADEGAGIARNPGARGATGRYLSRAFRARRRNRAHRRVAFQCQRAEWNYKRA